MQMHPISIVIFKVSLNAIKLCECVKTYKIYSAIHYQLIKSSCVNHMPVTNVRLL